MEKQSKRPENMPRQVKAQQPKLKEEKPLAPSFAAASTASGMGLRKDSRITPMGN